MIRGFTAALALSLLSTAALADAPAPAPYDWTGLYAGASLGLASASGTAADLDYYNYAETTRTFSSSIMGSLDAGYNLQRGNIVYGVEADLGMLDAGRRYDFYGTERYLACKYCSTSRIGALGSARARVGVAFDKALIYATGGLAFGQVNNRWEYSGLKASDNGWKTGYAVGAGIDYAVSPSWTVRAEGIYYALEATTVGSTNANYSFRFKNTAQVARLGVNYGFDAKSMADGAASEAVSWTGPYVGASAGRATAKGGSDDLDEYDYTRNYISAASSAIASVDAGYNLQMDSLVYGIEADIGKVRAISHEEWYDGGYKDCDYCMVNSISALGSVRGRLGYAFDKALFYATAGLAFGNVSNRWEESGSIKALENEWRTGVAVGAGVDYALTQNWVVRAEGMRYDLGSKTVTEEGYRFRFSNRADVFRMGVNYNF